MLLRYAPMTVKRYAQAQMHPGNLQTNLNRFLIYGPNFEANLH